MAKYITLDQLKAYHGDDDEFTLLNQLLELVNEEVTLSHYTQSIKDHNESLENT